MAGSVDEDRRIRCWKEFCHAADEASFGNDKPALKLTRLHPIVRDELQAYIQALKDGRIVKVGPYTYKSAKAPRSGQLA